ncbi:hypothetical protein BB561_005528, partial [Smittium simulii]
IRDYQIITKLVYKTMELSEKNPKLNKEQDNLLLNTEEFDTVVKANSKTKKKVYSDKKTPLSAPTDTAPKNIVSTDLGNKNCIRTWTMYNIREESAHLPGEHQYCFIKAQRTRISVQRLQIISCYKTNNQALGDDNQHKVDDTKSSNRQGKRLEKGSLQTNNQRQINFERSGFVHSKSTGNNCSTSHWTINAKKIVRAEKQSLDKNLELELTSINIGHRIAEPELTLSEISLYINEKETLAISKALCLTSAVEKLVLLYLGSTTSILCIKKHRGTSSLRLLNLLEKIWLHRLKTGTQPPNNKITCYSWYKKINAICLSTVVKLGTLERIVFFFNMESDSTSNIENLQKKTNTNTNNVPVDIRNMISRFDKIDDQKINIVTRNNNNFRPKCGKSPLSDKNKWCLTIWRLSGVFSKTNVTLKSQLKLWFLINDLLNVKKKIQQSNKNL